MRKVALIARQLLWQNRWLFLLLMLWPYAMAALLLVGNRHPEADDVLAILHQECIYSLALVVVTGSTQLGNEQRSRRIVAVLAQAVSRGEYLAALWLTAFLPLLLFLAGFAVSGAVLADAAAIAGGGAMQMAILQVAIGAWGAAAGVFWSTLLPSVFASIAATATVGAFAAAGYYDVPGPGRLMLQMMKIEEQARWTRAAALDLVLSCILAAAAIAAAWWIFSRRDLNLTAD